MDGDLLVLSASDIYPVVQRFLLHANFRCTLKVFQEEACLDDNPPQAKHGLAKLLQALDLTSACQQWINSHERTTRRVVRGAETGLSQGVDPITVLQDCIKKGSTEDISKDACATRKRKHENVASESQQSAKAARQSHRGFEVHVSNIPFSVDEVAMRKEFSICGTITNFHMPRKPDGSSNGYCFIAYDREEAAVEALKYNGREYQGRKLQVNLQGDEKNQSRREAQFSVPQGKKESDPFRIYLGNLPFRLDETAVKKKFSKCGTITKFHMPRKQDGSSNGYCFITYDSDDAVCSAMKYNGKEYDGRALNINRESEQKKPMSEREAKGATPPPPDMLVKHEAKGATLPPDMQGKNSTETSCNPLEVFVGNLPHNVDAEAVRKKFSKSGTITDLQMPLKPNGKSRRFCFVTYESEDAATASLKYNGREYQGRMLKVNLKEAPQIGKKLLAIKTDVEDEAP